MTPTAPWHGLCSSEARERAWAFLATLVGGLLLSRGVDDGEVADEILRACRRAVTRP